MLVSQCSHIFLRILFSIVRDVLAIEFLYGGEHLSKINPGTNVYGDNDVSTAQPGGMEDIKIPDPKMLEKGKFQCPVCNAVFKSKEDYISHALAEHQPPME